MPRREILAAGAAAVLLGGPPVVAQTDAALLGRSASEIENMDVLGERGEEIGEVDDVVRAADGLFAIVDVGGFLGVGEREVAIPLDAFRVTGDGDLLLPSASEEMVEGFGAYDDTAYEPLTDDTAVGDVQ